MSGIECCWLTEGARFKYLNSRGAFISEKDGLVTLGTMLPKKELSIFVFWSYSSLEGLDSPAAGDSSSSDEA